MGNYLRAEDTNHDNKFDDTLSTYSKLINMGFGDEISLKAAKVYPQNLNEAINYIQTQTKIQNDEYKMQEDTKDDNKTMQNTKDHIENVPISSKYSKRKPMPNEGPIEECEHTAHLIEILKTYTSGNYANNLESFLSQKRAILNDFNYFLEKHNSNNDAMHYVNSLLPHCDFKQCTAVLRQYRQTKDNATNTKRKDPKYITLQELFDRIHCHLAHCYELGSRLTVSEEQQLNHLAAQNKSTFGMDLCNTLLHKRKKMHFITQNSENTEESNKFCSNLGQSKVTETMYSFGFRFFYWDFHANFVQDADAEYISPDVGKLLAKPLYVASKYLTFKQELMAALSTETYQELLQKANDILESDRAKKISAFIDNYMADQKTAWAHISTYGVRDGSPIALRHIFALIVYTDMDEFQRRFSETFRLRKSETLSELKLRHSHFHFLARYLREAVECFGSMAVWRDTLTFYHGIDCTMQFESVSVNINGPLSTTTALNVAVNFATVKGIIVAMRPNFSLKYFDCCWIARYPHEMECFYIGGLLPHYFMNIINLNDDSESGMDTKHFITAIRLLEEMCNGNSFDLERMAVWRYIKKKRCDEVNKLGLKPLDNGLKNTVIQLLRHELHRNGVTAYNASAAKLGGYIDNLLHSVCSKKQQLRISIKLFDIEQYQKLDMFNGGYIGYSFLKEMFATHPSSECRMVNLDILCLLFPNVERIIICDIYNKEWMTNLILDIAFAFKNYGNLKVIDVIPQQEPDHDEIFQTIVRSVMFLKNLGEKVPFHNLREHYIDEVNDGKMVRIEKIR